MKTSFWSTYFAIKAAHRSIEYEEYLRANNLTRKEDRKLRREDKTRRREEKTARIATKMQVFADKLNATTAKIETSNKRLKQKWFGKKR